MGAQPAALPVVSPSPMPSSCSFRSRLVLTLGRSGDNEQRIRSLAQPSSGAGLGSGALADAIESGRVKAMLIGNPLPVALPLSIPRSCQRWLSSSFSSWLMLMRITLSAPWPTSSCRKAMSMELDGTYTSFDRTVSATSRGCAAHGRGQECDRRSFQPLSAARVRDGVTGVPHRSWTRVPTVPGYAGISYARLERSGISVPPGRSPTPDHRSSRSRAAAGFVTAATHRGSQRAIANPVGARNV